MVYARCYALVLAAILGAASAGAGHGPGKKKSSAASVQTVLPDCVANTANVWMPSPSNGKCYCGGHANKEGTPIRRSSSQAELGVECPETTRKLELNGLTKRECTIDGADAAVGGSCGWYCVCANSPGSEAPTKGVSCCKAGANFGLKANVVIKTTAEDFLPVPSHSRTVLPMTGLVLFGLAIATLIG